MVENWQQLEEQCFEYLKKKYPNTTFIYYGKSDSTNPDILVKNYSSNYYIEVKSPQAQCGQFVLIPNQQKSVFTYSAQNKSPSNKSTEIIMKYMNEHFSYYVSAGADGLDINIDKRVFYDWIISYYSQKKVKYFMTEYNGFIIFPIDKFPAYFDVTCCYRVKKSGSSTPNQNNLIEIGHELKRNGIDFKFSKKANAYYVETSLNLSDYKITGLKYDYILRKEDSTHFKIRRLSNTYNANVIFKIHLKKQFQEKSDLLAFEQNN